MWPCCMRFGCVRPRNEEEGPLWAYRGKDLKEEAEGLYAERWRAGSSCNEDMKLNG